MEDLGKGLRLCTSARYDRLHPEGDIGAILKSFLGWEESSRLLSRSCSAVGAETWIPAVA